MARVHPSTALAEAVSWYSSLLLALMLVLSCCESGELGEYATDEQLEMPESDSRRCDEIYVVGEGETLHTIIDKCGDPYLVEENPHINDPDDVFPGLLIRIRPFRNQS